MRATTSSRKSPSVYSQDDPLTLAMRPPPTETDNERRTRILREAEAQRISQTIDDQIRQDRESFKKRKGDVKLLLLGQSESGKSTLQKQFQLMYSPRTLETERLSWRVVVYYNVLRSVKQILSTLDTWADAEDGPSDELYDHTAHSKSPADQTLTSLSRRASKQAHKVEVATLRLKLSPLVTQEEKLAVHLSGGVTIPSTSKGDLFVRSGWQSRAMERHIEDDQSAKMSMDTTRSSFDGFDCLVGNTAQCLQNLQQDIVELWNLPLTKVLISQRKLRLDEWSEFFLNEIQRVAARNYIPSTEDILHARIQTIGVAEHIFDVHVNGRTVPWHLYDVGGARGQRHTWAPYFDDANAIIFVAPVSAFDQYLEEDPKINRVDDSLQLFTQICQNPLLQNVHLVLFLNKTDLLKKKLERGLSIRRYITSYGDRPNEYDAVVNYFRAHFLQVHRKNNMNKRVLYTHLTSVVDTKTTQSIIGNVRDSIFRGYLSSAALV